MLCFAGLLMLHTCKVEQCLKYVLAVSHGNLVVICLFDRRKSQTGNLSGENSAVAFNHSTSKTCGHDNSTWPSSWWLPNIQEGQIPAANVLPKCSRSTSIGSTATASDASYGCGQTSRYMLLENSLEKLWRHKQQVHAGTAGFNAVHTGLGWFVEHGLAKSLVLPVQHGGQLLALPLVAPSLQLLRSLDQLLY